jgi:hypothetical protein
MRIRRRATILEERSRRDREPRVGLETGARPEKGSGGGVENIRGAGRVAEAAAGGPGRGSEVAVGVSGGGAEAAAVVESTVWFEGKAEDRTLFSVQIASNDALVGTGAYPGLILVSSGTGRACASRIAWVWEMRVRKDVAGGAARKASPIADRVSTGQEALVDVSFTSAASGFVSGATSSMLDLTGSG